MKLFSDLKIGARLIVLILAALVALCGITGFGIYESRRVYTAASYSTVNTVPSFVVLDDAQLAFDSMLLLVNQHVFSTNADQAKDFEQKIAQQRREVDNQFAKYEPLLSNDKDKEMLATDRALMSQLDAVRDNVLALSRDGKKQEAGDLMGTRMTEIAKQTNAALAAHRAFNVDLGQAGSNEAKDIIDRAVMLEPSAAAVVLAVVLWLGVLISRSITKPMGDAVKFARTVADGDLTTHIDATSKDETGQLLKALADMNDSLKRIVGRVRMGSDAVATASGQIASGNLDLSSRTEEQAASLQETASSMEELTSTVRQNAENAQQASGLASNASDVALRGSAVVGQVVDTMTDISERSSKIAEIIGIIEGIAFQTNILALNAAVEAARAGEQGRGFAVVAGEVRGLAQRSSSAAKEIKDLISASVQKIRDGSALADEAGKTMTEVTQAVARVTDIMGEIAAASAEQSRGIDQVNLAITQMDQVTQQNAALVEEAAAASQSLEDQGRELKQAVAFFRVDGMAADAVAPHRRIAAPTFAAATASAPRAVEASKPAASTAAAAARAPAVAVARAPAAADANADWETF
ncbi:methyl-accepting chemotaxis protein [Burkholderia oklahomensis]|uniref:methyl-accepting chemotaxis protein n=1 Tax=Burkholderia oklahomensis TaxID=342113 RepID=UPI00016A7967|nr:methyl-accepting chemotaxis protein [Burkholderia oklahomensis]AJX34693.1 methyl-accepting chemotaxis (MCP) signaling domain protein [Burkholderia oklahomensis C6786]AOI49623.1 chemotaxis protein [Burkholderia oklahomensis C6786]KUY55651.1 chemotaxis protein [Burkholderia oklahomensis C6786]MBI0362092.1 MCP four helix bundle domain-containing protein [Burkholderia oklahomensis]SUY29041.1 Serine chemoreceptor protein [Burkholderia oklahomensis]